MGKRVKYFFYIFLIFIPFGTRFLLHRFTAGFDEYETIFIYLGDIFMLGFLASFFWEFGIGQFRQQKKSLFLKIFLALCAVSILAAFSKPIAIYNLVRLVLLAITALVVAKCLRLGVTKIQNIFAVLAGSAVLQALIGVGQFIKQESLGLARLGEPMIGPNVGGAAKIIAEGGKVLRAYGTFPHPNVLAAFLVIGLLAMYYFWLNRPSEWKVFSGWKTLRSDLFYGLGIFVVILGLTFAFSRAAWAVAAISSLFVVSYSLFVRRNWVQAVRLSILLVAVVIILFIGFGNFILPRAQISSSEPAVTQRIGYNEIAIGLIKNNLLGVGIGNQVLYSVKNEVYQRAGMDQVWQWQPIHNIYLLMGAEIGILGLVAWIIFISGLLISNFQFLISKQISISKKIPIPDSQLEIGNLSLVISLTMLLALLMLGLFDHFLWTLQPGRLMLWLVIGIVLAQKRP